jgi:hypothetical protein
MLAVIAIFDSPFVVLTGMGRQGRSLLDAQVVKKGLREPLFRV